MSNPKFRTRIAGLLLLTLISTASGCGTAIDKARIQLNNALKVSFSAQGRYKTQELVYLLDLAKPPRTKQEAMRLFEAYKLNRQPIEAEIARCQIIMDEARDLLLLSDDSRGISAAENAAGCAASLLEKINKLFSGS